MQFAEAGIWASMKWSKCNIVNKFITMFIIPIILMLQVFGPLYGYLFEKPWNKLSHTIKQFFKFFTIFIILLVIIAQYRSVKRNCTIISNQGHLYWLMSSYPGSGGFSGYLVHYIWLGLILIPFILFWKYNILLPFSIVLIGLIYGIHFTDSKSSIWCFVTSFTSILFLLIYFYETYYEKKLV